MMRGLCVLTIGNFDGCHIGHAALIRRARTLADQTDSKIVVMSFFPHPAALLRPEYAPPLLTDWHERVRLLKDLGADEIVMLEPTGNLLGLDPLEFAQQWIEPRNPTHIIEGPDFHFGKERAGNLNVLRVIGSALGFEVDEVSPVQGVLTDHNEVLVSSTTIRKLIAAGRVRDAAALLGRHYAVTGTVVRGDRLGRQIGFPTANIECKVMTPADGVYAGIASLPTGHTFPAAISMGTRPTVDGDMRKFEVHLLDAPTEDERIAGLPEYGWDISVELVGRIRDQIKFGSVDELTEQLTRDCSRVEGMLNRTIGTGTTA